MNLPFFIARKYFLSKKKKSFINFISIISMFGVAIGLSALIIILSVFNGLEDLNREVFKAFDPDLKISAEKTKSFEVPEKLISEIRKMDEVAYCTTVYQDKALAKNDKAQTIVDIKGVDSTFKQHSDFKKSLVGGEMSVYIGNRPAAYIGAEVYNSLQLTVNDFFNPINILYPKNQKLNILNPEDNINQVALEVSGVFLLEKNFDNFLYVPIEVMEELSGVYGKCTALEIKAKDEKQLQKLKKEISGKLSQGLVVKDRDEQNESLMKAIRIEKLFVFVGLFFVVGIAAFNIFYALSMLVLDKKDDIQTLSSMGGQASFIRRIFLLESFIIAGIGIIFGLIIGLGVCWIQLHFGIIGLGMTHTITDAYPVRISAMDVLLSVTGILIISFLAALIPAQKAAEFMVENVKN